MPNNKKDNLNKLLKPDKNKTSKKLPSDSNSDNIKQVNNNFNILQKASDKSKKYKDLERVLKNQTYLSQDNRTDVDRKWDRLLAEENRPFIEKLEETTLPILDVISGAASLGNFIPHPLAQTIGKAGNIIGGVVDSYQGIRALQDNDYENALINGAALGVPLSLSAKSFKRNSKYLKDGDFLSNTRKEIGIDQFGNKQYENVFYNNIDRPTRHMSNSNAIDYNRALLGTNIAETGYDIQDFAYGGNTNNLNNINNSKMLKEFNTGGTHESNPLGGIPLGMNPQGQSVTVEEGETSLPQEGGDYIYSNRIKIDNNHLKQYSLPKSYKGKSIADLSKVIENKFKDREDSISISTKDKMLSDLMNLQESIRSEEQAKIAEALNMNMEDPVQGTPPVGIDPYMQQPMAEGGATGNGYGGLISAGVNLGAGLFNRSSSPDVDEYGLQATEKVNKGAIIAGGAGTGASIGGTVGSVIPVIGTTIGAAAGAVIGGVAGAFSAGSKARKQERIAGNNAFIMNKQNSENYALGGFTGNDPRFPSLDTLNYGINQLNTNPTMRAQRALVDNGYNIPVDGNWGPGSIKAQNDLAKRSGVNLGKNTSPNNDLLGLGSDGLGITPYPQLTKPVPYRDYSGDTSNPFSINYQGPNIPTDIQSGMINSGTPSSTTSSSTNNRLDTSSLGRALRYAPVVQNALAARNLNRNRPQMQAPILDEGQATRRYVDEQALINQADNAQNQVVNALTNSGMSGGALRNSLLASQLNRARGLSDAFLNAENINRGVDERADSINRDIQARNTAERIRVAENYDRDLGNYQTQKSRLAGQLGTDLGNIGREEVYKDLAVKATGYTWDGEYYKNDKGEKLSPLEYAKKFFKNKDDKALGGFVFNKGK